MPIALLDTVWSRSIAWFLILSVWSAYHLESSLGTLRENMGTERTKSRLGLFPLTFALVALSLSECRVSALRFRSPQTAPCCAGICFWALALGWWPWSRPISWAFSNDHGQLKPHRWKPDDVWESSVDTAHITVESATSSTLERHQRRYYKHNASGGIHGCGGLTEVRSWIPLPPVFKYSWVEELPSPRPFNVECNAKTDGGWDAAVFFLLQSLEKVKGTFFLCAAAAEV